MIRLRETPTGRQTAADHYAHSARTALTSGCSLQALAFFRFFSSSWPLLVAFLASSWRSCLQLGYLCGFFSISNRFWVSPEAPRP